MNEYEVIEAILRKGRAGRLPPGYLPVGDDVSVVPAAKKKVVVKCDMLVSKTDMPPRMTYREAARKAVAMCVSDFAAKGARPDSFLVSLGLPAGTGRETVGQLALGFADARREWGLNLVGGDTNESSDLVIDCVMLGFADRVVPRSGAKPGQCVVVSDYFGYPPSGLRILAGAKAEGTFRRRALESVLRPSPKLELGIAMARYLSSSMDSSDGLAICLHTLSEMSGGVGMLVDTLPYRRELAGFAARNGYPFRDLVLYGGEEYEVVGTMERRLLPAASRAARALGRRLMVIGEVTAEKGVIVTGDGTPIEKRGWVHLSGPPT